jgi:hypothetical protein
MQRARLTRSRASQGFKRLENYVKHVYTPQQRIRRSKATTREDLETLEIELERQRDQLESWKHVERIIDSRTAPANADIDHDHRARLVPSAQGGPQLTAEAPS